MERPEVRIPQRGPSSAAAVWVAVVATLLTGLSGIGADRRAPPVPQVTKVTLPAGARSDLGEPRFSRPTAVTNPLFPVSQLHQVIQLGAERTDRLRFEMTLLPETRTIDWNGRPVDTVVSQLVAYGDGRVVEVATDFYAQSDDGAVWHFGEDVSNYDGGVLVDRQGSWLAGRDGPPGMVMPADPRVGDVFRSRNGPGQDAEEVTVRSADQRVEGPRGPVEGALLLQEQAVDGTLEDKTFAPGYGELNARVPAQDELYNVALALPTDAAPGPAPEELATVAGEVGRILSASRLDPRRSPRSGSPDWAAVVASVHAMTEAWDGAAPSQAASMLVAQMSDRLAALVAAAAARRPARVQQAALDVAQAGLDLQLRHRSPADVDRDRLRLVASQLLVDAAAADGGAVDGDVVVLDALWARIARPPGPDRGSVDTALAELRAAAQADALARAATVAATIAVP